MDLTHALGQALTAIGQLVPRLVIIHWTDAGVLWSGGREPRVLGPGCHFIWPLFQTVEKVPVKMISTLHLSSRPLTTKDCHTVQMDVVVTYRVTNPYNWFVCLAEAEDTLDDIALRAVKDYVCTMPYTALLESLDELDDELGSEIQAYLGDFGVEIESAGITSFSRTAVHHLAGPGLTLTQ